MPNICHAADARDPQAYARALGGEKAALLLTDPPYCLLTRRRREGDLRDPKGRKIEGEPVIRFESVRDYRKFTESWLPPAIDNLQNAAPLVVWTNFLGKDPILQTALAAGYRFCGEFAWCKLSGEVRSGHVLRGNEELARIFEVALVFARSERAPAPLDAPAECWSIVAGPDDDGEAARWGNHPNHKPFGVIEPLVRRWSRTSELILDPFAGSGSIPAAALRLGRRASCLELRPEWAGRVSERLKGISSA
jgi:site-specific DNA-methyltransferase (adenine-specific)